MKSLDLVRAGKLIAHPDFIFTPLDILLDVCNGCGQAGKFDFVPDTILGLWVGPNCNLHDYWYYRGTTEQDKEQADMEMLFNNLRAIEACSTWILKPFRRQRALTYYATVTDLGHNAYWKGKEKP